jgi:hypothetical protein
VFDKWLGCAERSRKIPASIFPGQGFPPAILAGGQASLLAVLRCSGAERED